ncbi:hypothetical protein N7475_005146 [Penicillium sp. IBT 31633x]|nr:hypothetical protein N7475_005146 [Penicillium sp. IBT 31633x]
MALDRLSTEILLAILECLSSPLDLLPAVHASSTIYRIYIAYKQHLRQHTLHQAISPACQADVYTALNAQNIPNSINSGRGLAKIKAECFSLFADDRIRRRQNNDQFSVPKEKLDTLFHLHVKLERLIDMYCHWSLGNLASHPAKPTPFELRNTRPRADLSDAERARLQRAVYRCEIYARFQRVLHLLTDKSAALNFSQIVLSFVSQFTLYEFEEIVSTQQFLAQFVRSLCQKVEDDVLKFCYSTGTLDAGVEKESLDKATTNQHQYPDDLSFFTKAYRDTHHSGHVKFLISCGLPYLLHLSLLDTHALKTIILSSYMKSRENTITDFFSQDGLEIESCDEKMKNTVLRGKLVSIPVDETGSMNLGWKWATSFHDFAKPDSPAMFDLRNQGYVFWDQERLRESEIVSEPHVVCVGANYFPPGHRGPFLTPSVEERLGGLEVDYEVLRKWRDK